MNDSLEKQGSGCDVQQQCALILNDLYPVIHSAARFVRLLQWKEEEKYSIILLCLWIILKPYYQGVLYFLPLCFLIHSLYQSQLNRSGTTANVRSSKSSNNSYQQELLLEDLKEFYESIYFMDRMNNFFRQTDTLLGYAYSDISYLIDSKISRSCVCKGTACLFYATWLLFLHQYSFIFLIWLTVLTYMCLQSPWTKPIVIACARILVPILYQFLQRQNGEKSICTNRKDKDDLKIYCFEVYHHQRWWFPTGWSKILLPQDYPLWSDIYLEPTPSIHNFRLPPPTLTGKINEKNQQKMTLWVWIDSNWTIYRSDSVADKDSWEYSTWQWKNWSTRSNKFDICTRRQKWYRRAQRKEFWIDMNDSIEESCMCDYSCTTTCTSSLSSSSSSSHSHTSTVVKEACSVTEPVHSNNIVSYDNKGERMFRRLSLNSSNNSSKSFSIQEHNHGLSLVESGAFKKYYKSPKPQKIMKLQK